MQNRLHSHTNLASKGVLLGLTALLLGTLLACGGGGAAEPGTAAPIISDFAVNPVSIAPGDTATLAWSVAGATSLSLDHGLGSVAAEGNAVVNPVVTTVYRLTATNEAGTSTAQATLTVSGGSMATGFVTKSLAGRAYSIYVPPTYNDNPSRVWPLIVFQHGSGERGTDGSRPNQVGLGPQIRNHPDWFPCLVLFPQVDLSNNNPWEAQYEQTLLDYRIDTTRVFMTGLSLGGMATWQAGAGYPDHFAALMPLCAEIGVSPAGIANLATTPIRTFIGDQDGIFSIPNLQNLVAAIAAQGGDIQLTIFPGVGHNCWDRVYSEPANIAWLLSHQR